MNNPGIKSIWIDGKDIGDYGAIVESFKVGGTVLKNELFQGRNRTHYNVLSSVFGRRPITVNIFFKAKTRRELTLNKSALDSLLFGKVELYLPDGFYYSAVITSAGDSQMLGVDGNEVICLTTYTFEGVRHDEKVTHTGNTLYCASTMPYTDCKLTCKASQARDSLTVDTVTITNVAKNDIIVVDGIEGRILQNGAPCAGNMSFVHFPRLVPGQNTLTCPETLTVEYYPTYI